MLGEKVELTEYGQKQMDWVDKNCILKKQLEGKISSIIMLKIKIWLSENFTKPYKPIHPEII